ncbi:MAG: FxsA family protein [Alphaproteobacteria bacterium]|nr:FxsA family protein [Alphaproteobacteria bacterium]
MRFILFLFFVAIPFIELALLISLGSTIGFWPTIGIVVFTALVGAYVLHSQGLATMRRMSEAMSSGEPPIGPVVDGFFLAIAGAFLLTPGVITDGIGLLLLIPGVRRVIVQWGFGQIAKRGSFTVHAYKTGGQTGSKSGSKSGSKTGGSPDDGEPQRQPPPRSEPTGHRNPNRQTRSHGPVIDAEFEEIRKKK